MNELMDLIDDVKDSIGDGKYLEICNIMKKIHMTSTPTRTTYTFTPSHIAQDLILVQKFHKHILDSKRNRKVKIIYEDNHRPKVMFNNIELEWSSTEEGDHIYTYHINDKVTYRVMFETTFKTDDNAVCLMEVIYLNTAILLFTNEDLSIIKQN